MLILLYKVGEEPKPMIIKRDYKSMQKLVGGNIENYQVNEKICLICDDEGYIKGRPVNRRVVDKSGIIHQAICGDFFVCGAGEEDFVSLTCGQASRIIKRSEPGIYPGWIE